MDIFLCPLSAREGASALAQNSITSSDRRVSGVLRLCTDQWSCIFKYILSQRATDHRMRHGAWGTGHGARSTGHGAASITWEHAGVGVTRSATESGRVPHQPSRTARTGAFATAAEGPRGSRCKSLSCSEGKACSAWCQAWGWG